MATTTTTPNNHQFTDLQQEEPNPNSYALSGKIMLASIIILFAVVIFLLLLHLYARWYLLRLHRRNHHHHRRNRHNRSTRIIFYLDPTTPTTTTSALDPSILKTLPLFVYSPENDKNTPPECAVCLSEFEKGETGRVLPKCGHSFHTECIDMWFHSNSTCPLCRSPVEAAAGESEMAVLVQPSPEFIMCEPVRPGSGVLLSSPQVRPGLGGLYSGLPVRPGSSESETTSLGDRRKGMDVRIDVPNRNELLAAAADNEFRLVSPSHGFRSPASRLLALKRILSMGRKSPSAAGVGPSRLPAAAESDLESAVEESARLEGGGNNSIR